MISNRSATSLVPEKTWLKASPFNEQPLGLGFLVLVSLLGFFLRFYSLTGQSLWVDEVMSWGMMRPEAGLHFFEQIRDAIQGPLYLAVTWPLLRLHDSALMLRLVPAAAGCFTIPLFTLMADRLFGGRTARVAGLLLALSPFHVWYSQEGRGYGLLMLFCVAMGYLLLRMTSEGPDLRRAILFAICSAGAVWSNMSGLFLWGAMGLGVLVTCPPRTARQWGLWSLAFGGGLAAVFPWILKAAGIWAVDRMVVGQPMGEALRGETTFTPLALPYTIFTFFYGYSLGPSLRELHLADKWAVLKPAVPLLLAAAAPVAAGLVAGLVKLRGRNWVLLIWIAVPVLVLVLLAVRNVKPWNPRYIAVVFPWVLVLMAYGLTQLPRRAGAVLTLFMAGLALFSLGNYYWNGRYAKADLRGMAALVSSMEAQQGGPARPLLVPAVANVFNYYHQGQGEVITTYGTPALQETEDVDLFLDEVLVGRDRIFWVKAREWYFDPHGLLPAGLARRGHLRLVQELPGATLYSWQEKDIDKGSDEPE